MHDELVFWFSQPPKVERGAYNEMTYLWDNKVYYICLGEWGEDRKKLNWDDNNYGNAQVIYLNQVGDMDAFIKNFMEEHPSAINIVAGISSAIAKKVYMHCNDKTKICTVTERPVPFYTKTGTLNRILRAIVKTVKYSALCCKYRNRIDVLLPLGQLGVKEYHRVGWPKDRMYPFMYCPELQMYEPVYHNEENREIRFLYIGRFMYSTKGIDYLAKSVKMLKGDNWVLDMVGGYGKDRDKIIEWINSEEHVNFMGSWKSEEVVKNIRDYDVVIVPSKGEGWNMIVYEAMAASVGVICTDLAVSDEMIAASGAGVVVPAFSAKAIYKAMQSVIDNPGLINEWKDKARQYQSRITSRDVAQYLAAILEHTYYGGEEPVCPWIN